jgi:hypothetical protein
MACCSVVYADEKKFFLSSGSWTMSAGQMGSEEIWRRRPEHPELHQEPALYFGSRHGFEFAGLWFHYDETFGVGGLTGET